MPEYRCHKCGKPIDESLLKPKPGVTRFGLMGVVLPTPTPPTTTRLATCPHCSARNKFEVPHS